MRTLPLPWRSRRKLRAELDRAEVALSLVRQALVDTGHFQFDDSPAAPPERIAAAARLLRGIVAGELAVRDAQIAGLSRLVDLLRSGAPDEGELGRLRTELVRLRRAMYAAEDRLEFCRDHHGD